MPEETVLGLSVGTRFVGMAVAKDGSLEDWQVRTFKGKWTREKMKNITLFIDRCIKDHGVTSVILKVPESCRTSQAVLTLTQALICLCEQKGIKVMTCTINRLKDICEANNKAELMQATLVHFPELTYLLDKTQKTKKIHHVKIFESALATLL